MKNPTFQRFGFISMRRLAGTGVAMLLTMTTFGCGETKKVTIDPQMDKMSPEQRAQVEELIRNNPVNAPLPTGDAATKPKPGSTGATPPKTTPEGT